MLRKSAGQAVVRGVMNVTLSEAKYFNTLVNKLVSGSRVYGTYVCVCARFILFQKRGHLASSERCN